MSSSPVAIHWLKDKLLISIIHPTSYAGLLNNAPFSQIPHYRVTLSIHPIFCSTFLHPSNVLCHPAWHPSIHPIFSAAWFQSHPSDLLSSLFNISPSIQSPLPSRLTLLHPSNHLSSLINISPSIHPSNLLYHPTRHPSIHPIFVPLCPSTLIYQPSQHFFINPNSSTISLDIPSFIQTSLQPFQTFLHLSNPLYLPIFIPPCLISLHPSTLIYPPSQHFFIKPIFSPACSSFLHPSI